jgi:hypothetical protein
MKLPKVPTQIPFVIFAISCEILFPPSVRGVSADFRAGECKGRNAPNEFGQRPNPKPFVTFATFCSNPLLTFCVSRVLVDGAALKSP